MKKAKLILSLVLIILVALQSCEKSSILDTETSAVNDGANNLSVENGMLVFSSKEFYLEIYHELDRKNEEFQNKVSKNSLSDSNESELGTTDNKVLKNFEKQHSFFSLRKQIEEKEEIWLNKETLDLENDPDEHFVNGEVLRTLLNPNAEIKIGNSIFKMTESGIMYEITNSDMEILDNLRNGVFDDSDKLIKHFKNDSKGYYLNKHRTVQRYYDDNKKMFKAKVTVTNAPYLRFIKGTTRSFKKKRNSWKRQFLKNHHKLY